MGGMNNMQANQQGGLSNIKWVTQAAVNALALGAQNPKKVIIVSYIKSRALELIATFFAIILFTSSWAMDCGVNLGLFFFEMWNKIVG